MQRADASSLLGVTVGPGLLGLQRGDEELFDCLSSAIVVPRATHGSLA